MNLSFAAPPPFTEKEIALVDPVVASFLAHAILILLYVERPVNVTDVAVKLCTN
jgi:hypothetical protein